MLAKMLLWRDLKLDDARRRDIASRCFYIGKGVEETRRFLDRKNEGDDADLTDLTNLCGYKPELHEIPEIK